ncbi:uncharacterized protein LOC142551077 isoform X2 [Primulina tabacum]|uniref:uncharacterized protein LOC142551077 isoform X2 n=1 Tax=Primulina tabacum TaxID=48773 RepID=UPI003F59645A
MRAVQNSNLLFNLHSRGFYVRDAEWVAGFAERISASSSDSDPSSEGWITDCFNDVDMSFNMEDISASGTTDIQIDIIDIFNSPLNMMLMLSKSICFTLVEMLFSKVENH